MVPLVDKCNQRKGSLMSGYKLVDGSLAESFAVVLFLCMNVRALLMTELMFRSSSSVVLSLFLVGKQL
jgi:hypothetical protein